ncbi:MAG: Gfo/Idh/MocA family oxidoreductase [Gemmatimonadota bacterium]|nr:Gfo/Idh/MocA family oxidoreductase [Gemmatimonadota bacterium]MDH4348292.1 Gfo/Idh/MocA family oxidoreductase [Gemmatimonadota bacterium]MDH5282387.1 Gfo/Idh/MocA family oxidoreductase [Gemmatimonadota bacterium]
MPLRSHPLHLAILGTGRMARGHRRTIRRLDPSVRCSFASRDFGRAARLAGEFGDRASWESYGAAIEAPSVDAVVIATPPSEHFTLALAALRAGKDVVVEKPAFLTLADLDEIASSAGEAGRQVLVAENYCYKPLAAALREVVTSGRLGEVRFVQINALKRTARSDWRDDPGVAGGGALFEGGVHWVDLIAHLGLTVESVEGLQPGALSGLERSTLMVVQFEEGAVGTLAHSWETPGRMRGLQLSRITGTEGSVSFESNGLFLHEYSPGRSRWSLPGLRDIEGFRAMWADFIRVLRDGDAPRMTLARARRGLELVEAASQGTEFPITSGAERIRAPAPRRA